MGMVDSDSRSHPKDAGTMKAVGNRVGTGLENDCSAPQDMNTDSTGAIVKVSCGQYHSAALNGKNSLISAIDHI
jgi:hypothetical protein